jgi:long-chain acyl-CoA synthetase
MKGYHKNPKANEESFITLPSNGKRYFRTGDQGRFDGKYLHITGRISEQFKLKNGKFIVPALLEDICTRGPLIGQAFVCGLNQSKTVMLIVPNYLELAVWAKENNYSDFLSLLPKNPLKITDDETKKIELLFSKKEFIKAVSNEV